MSESLESRINAMCRRDKIMGTVFVILCWMAVAAVYIPVVSWVPDTGIRVALTIAAAMLVIFNTASITAMIRHYEEDKHFIYELDIRHLDAARAAKTE